MKLRRIPMAIIALALAAAGCNATGATPIPPVVTQAPTRAPTTPAPVVSTPEALRGSWTADIQGTTASSGIWTLVITESNVMLQNPFGELFSVGPTSVSETAMVLAASPDCPDQSTVTPGTYILALAGDALTITVEADSCGDRSGVLATTPWTRKP